MRSGKSNGKGIHDPYLNKEWFVSVRSRRGRARHEESSNRELSVWDDMEIRDGIVSVRLPVKGKTGRKK